MVLIVTLAGLGSVLGGWIFRFSDYFHAAPQHRYGNLVSRVLVPEPWNRGFEVQTREFGMYYALAVSPYLGAVVLSTWFLLALMRTGRPQRHWLDRSGRLLGVAWILIFALCVVTGLPELSEW